MQPSLMLLITPVTSLIVDVPPEAAEKCSSLQLHTLSVRSLVPSSHMFPCCPAADPEQETCPPSQPVFCQSQRAAAALLCPVSGWSSAVCLFSTRLHRQSDHTQTDLHLLSFKQDKSSRVLQWCHCVCPAVCCSRSGDFKTGSITAVCSDWTESVQKSH